MRTSEAYRRRSHLVLIVFLLALWLIFSHFLSRLPYVEMILNDLDNFHKAQVDLFTKKNESLITLATLLIGGIGTLLTATWARGMPIPEAARRPALACCICAVSSMLFGHFSLQGVLWMLQKEVLNLSNMRVSIPEGLQFAFFLFGVVFFFRFALGLTSRMEPKKKEEP